MVTLMHGDCLNLMKSIPDGTVDAVIADVPYGTTACKWDSVIDLEQMWAELKRIVKPNGAIVMTAAQPFTTTLIASNMAMFKQCLVWDKVAPRGFLNAKRMHLARHEDIVIFGAKPITYNPIMQVRGAPRRKGSYSKNKADSAYGKTAEDFRKTEAAQVKNNTYYPTSIVQVSNAVQIGKVHPTQKPVALMEYLINTYTNVGETVLDFTMGSGTTGVACVNTGRKFIGIELDTEYFNIAKKRIHDV